MVYYAMEVIIYSNNILILMNKDDKDEIKE